MALVTLSSKGQLVIPKEIRDILGIKAKQKLFLRVVENHVEIEPLPENSVEYLCGIFKEHPDSLAKELLKERNKELKNEENNIAGFACGIGISETRSRIRKSQERAGKSK